MTLPRLFTALYGVSGPALKIGYKKSFEGSIVEGKIV